MGRIEVGVVRRFEFPEGATPIADCSGLIPNWVYHLDDLNRVEAENIAHAQRKYLRPPVTDSKNSIFPEKWIFQNGSYRTTKVNGAVDLIGQYQGELGKESAGQIFPKEKMSGYMPMRGQL